MNEFIRQAETTIQNCIKSNNEKFEILKTVFSENNEIMLTFDEIVKYFHVVENKVAEKIKDQWVQSTDPAQASKDRHDLYGKLTNINYGLDYIVTGFAQTLSEEHINIMKEIIANDKQIYNLLKEIFTITKP